MEETEETSVNDHNELNTPIPCPAPLRRDALGVEMVLECSGQFLTRDSLQPYFDKGVKKVLVSAPVKDPADPVLNIVYGKEVGGWWGGCELEDSS